ncbi:MAG: carbohydrate binding family 9 domain-containing protein [Anaeromyxobacter sp.]|nr:carbohydrate binding family 9 domain-containing protein [Anaeromyxobacter sp.]MBL0278209.1 carbohydrate binding family 9 domain-containing protein [Anaeromyxobacter sp.]
MPTLALAALLAATLTGGAPGDPVRAARLEGALTLDGRLEEQAWHAAPAFDGFVQLSPQQGAAPSERTAVRVLYDDRNLYVGVLCQDARPGEVSRPLGRRDNAPRSDRVAVYLDSNRDRRTAYAFELNAAGVQTDVLLHGDDLENLEWDAVWDGATAATADGWSAEFVLPLSIFRFSATPEQVWGLAVKRVLRSAEELVSIPLRRGDRGVVARFAELTGLSGLRPVQELSVAPYLATRVTTRPRYDDDTRPRPRLTDPSADLGVDLRASLGRGLSLQASLNPDFGQVEADQLVQNLSNYELFFPEKRPFFTQGLDLFQGPAPHNQPSPQQLFYSRRVGLDAPILAAAKLTGRVTDQLQVGLVEAVVTGAGAPAGSTEDHPVRGYRFSPRQPLHFGPAGSLPSPAPASRNFAAAVARWHPSATATFGLFAASAALLGADCTTLQANSSGDRPGACDVLAGDALALDFNLRSTDSEWFLRGQLTGSRYAGGEWSAQEDPVTGDPLALEPLRRLADGTALRRGELGGGAFLAFGRNGGEPWRFDVDLEWESPTLELNAVGYQRTQNELRLRPIARYVRPTGGGPFHEHLQGVGADLRATADAARRRGLTFFYFNELVLRSLHSLGCEVDLDLEGDDVREIEGSGVAFGRAGSWSGNCWVNTSKSRPYFLELWGGGGRTLPLAPLRTVDFWFAGALVSARPHPGVETRFAVGYERNAWPARWVETTAAGDELFAELTAPLLTFTLRQQFLMTPRLTLQVYAQLFVTNGQYGPYYTGRAGPGGRIASASLAPATDPTLDPAYAAPDFHETALNLSAVLRWEWRLGSTLYLVYSRAAAEPGLSAGEVPAADLRPRGLGSGPTTDTFLLKWSWYWSA